MEDRCNELITKLNKTFKNLIQSAGCIEESISQSTDNPPEVEGLLDRLAKEIDAKFFAGQLEEQLKKQLKKQLEEQLEEYGDTIPPFSVVDKDYHPDNDNNPDSDNDNTPDSDNDNNTVPKRSEFTCVCQYTCGKWFVYDVYPRYLYDNNTYTLSYRGIKLYKNTYKVQPIPTEIKGIAIVDVDSNNKVLRRAGESIYTSTDDSYIKSIDDTLALGLVVDDFTFYGEWVIGYIKSGYIYPVVFNKSAQYASSITTYINNKGIPVADNCVIKKSGDKISIPDEMSVNFDCGIKSVECDAVKTVVCDTCELQGNQKITIKSNGIPAMFYTNLGDVRNIITYDELNLRRYMICYIVQEKKDNTVTDKVTYKMLTDFTSCDEFREEYQIEDVLQYVTHTYRTVSSKYTYVASTTSCKAHVYYESASVEEEDNISYCIDGKVIQNGYLTGETSTGLYSDSGVSGRVVLECDSLYDYIATAYIIAFPTDGQCASIYIKPHTYSGTLYQCSNTREGLDYAEYQEEPPSGEADQWVREVWCSYRKIFGRYYVSPSYAEYQYKTKTS